MLGKQRHKCFIAFLVVLISAGALRGQDTAGDELTPTERLYGLSLIWKEADYNFPRFQDLPALDWDSAYQAYIPKVLTAETTVDYYRLLIRFTALLRDGHTQVTMPSSVFEQHVFDQPHLRLEAVKGRAIVWAAADSLTSQIPLGSEVVAVDGTPTTEFLHTNVYPYMSGTSPRFRRSLGNGWYVNGIGLLWGRAGSEVAVTIRTPDGEERTVPLTRSSSSVRASWAQLDRSRSSGSFEFRWIDDAYAYVALNTFADAAQVARFDSIASELRSANGVIIDLRQNGGGGDDVAKPIIARHLTSDTLEGSRSRTRVNDAARRAWGRYADQEWAREYAPYYTGEAFRELGRNAVVPDTSVAKIDVPVVVLIGRNTGSAAEDFLVWLDGLDAVTLVGEPTTGSTGMPLSLDLPGGASARILTKHDTYPDGREFLGVGVQPDIFVEPTVEDLIAGRDGMLMRALEVLRDRVQ